jgi:hypothetical protein
MNEQKLLFYSTFLRQIKRQNNTQHAVNKVSFKNIAQHINQLSQPNNSSNINKQTLLKSSESPCNTAYSQLSTITWSCISLNCILHIKFPVVHLAVFNKYYIYEKEHGRRKLKPENWHI